MKEPISTYADYCRVWAEVYKKHAKHSDCAVFSCYVRDGIRKALFRDELRKPRHEVTTNEDIIGIYIVRALVAQGMRESVILEHTEQMQAYVDAADRRHACVELMEQGLYDRGVDPLVEAPFIFNERNRMRYLWAKHGGFDLLAVIEL